MILITIISSPGCHLEVFWRRDSNNYVIVKPETDSRNLNTEKMQFVSRVFTRILLGQSRQEPLRPLSWCPQIYHNFEVSMSSPGAAPLPPCGRTAASSATARMMKQSGALSHTEWPKVKAFCIFVEQVFVSCYTNIDDARETGLMTGPDNWHSVTIAIWEDQNLSKHLYCKYQIDISCKI